MGIEGSGQNFLEGLASQYKDVMFKEKQFADYTVESTLIKSIQKAAKSQILDAGIERVMLRDLEGLKGRKLGQLSSLEQQTILNVFDQAIRRTGQEDIESAYGSGIVTPEELREQAQMTPDFLGEVLEKQQELKTHVKALLESNQYRDNIDNLVKAKKQGNNRFSLDLQPIEGLGEMTDEDLGIRETMPQKFQGDHFDAQRAQYVSIQFPPNPMFERSVSVVESKEEAKMIIAIAHAFAYGIASYPDYVRVLSHAVLLCTTQHIENWLLTPMMNVQRAIEPNGFEDFKTKLVSVNIQIDPLKTLFGKEKKDQFKVSVRAISHTMHRALVEEGLSKNTREARGLLGIKPMLEGCVEASFVCTADSPDTITTSNIQSKYYLTI